MSFLAVAVVLEITGTYYLAYATFIIPAVIAFILVCLVPDKRVV